ncbi:MAG: DNA recombination protein RmuC [Streptococcaceae bacterium]|jgi:DNA recombination protein RmuC|nr:DNA recombination protein RmuC [Streptococcaceae bacterium]
MIIYFIIGLIIGIVLTAILMALLGNARVSEAKAKTAQQFAGAVNQEELRANYVPAATFQVLQNQLTETKDDFQKFQENLDKDYVSRDSYDLVKEQLENLPKDILPKLVNQANDVLKEKREDLTKENSEKLQPALQPLQEAVKALTERVDKEEKEKISLKTEVSKLTELNQTLSTDAKNLTNALKGDNKVQGDWGELQLETILEASGVPFRKQNSFAGQLTETGNAQRPDFIIDLPDDKHLIVDSKMSLSAYTDYLNAENEVDKAEALKRHVTSVENHIKNELGEKHYERIEGVDTVDFVFMFVPVEGALTVAVEAKPDLINIALKNNVALVNSFNLVALLRTVSYLWTVDKQNKNVGEIAKIGGALYDKFVGFTENMSKIDSKLSDAKDAYSAAFSQLTTKNKDGSEKADTIIGRIEKLRELGADTKKEINSNLLLEVESSNDTD